MKAEKIIEIISKIELNTEDRRFFNALRKLDDKTLRAYPLPLQTLELLRREAEKEIRADAAKAAGDGEKLKIAERIIKRLKVYYIDRSGTAEAADAYHDENGRTIIADCFAAARLNNGIAGLNIRTERHPQGALVFENALNACEMRAADALPLPSISELTAFIKMQKAERKANGSGGTWQIYDFGDGFPSCDAEKLLELLILLTDKRRGIYPTATHAGERGNIYIKSELGDAVLCPVSKAAKKTA